MYVLLLFCNCLHKLQRIWVNNYKCHIILQLHSFHTSSLLRFGGIVLSHIQTDRLTFFLQTDLVQNLMPNYIFKLRVTCPLAIIELLNSQTHTQTDVQNLMLTYSFGIITIYQISSFNLVWFLSYDVPNFVTVLRLCYMYICLQARPYCKKHDNVS